MTNAQSPPYRQNDTSAVEWAASLSVADLDTIIGRSVEAKDFQGLRAALHLMAVKDPHRAEYWREVLLLGVAVGRARIASEEADHA